MSDALPLVIPMPSSDAFSNDLERELEETIIRRFWNTPPMEQSVTSGRSLVRVYYVNEVLYYHQTSETKKELT
jgi:hypothetical protein